MVKMRLKHKIELVIVALVDRFSLLSEAKNEADINPYSIELDPIVLAGVGQ
ncbi:hypothetical protein TUM4630_03770 [Shewanella algidipiscicola]|uniref:Uncharacterized protein n=1 Tax=Shewanella algidipiscicola TaxID=614070 RepID=A0ABQ4P4R9_9GAMM|nr:hypothetical protein TUM4630_03770 [Shewanella algidipiscicola]